MKSKIWVITPYSLFFFSTLACAEGPIFTPEKVSAEIGLGSLSGKTKERVYNPDNGEKISQLDWQYSRAAIVKGSIDWDLMPWFSVGASGWTTLGSRGGNMVDSDREYENNQEWVHQSNHPNTNLNAANEFDISLKGWFLAESNYRLGAMVGYKESRYSFKATGGTYYYTDETTGLPFSGSFPVDSIVSGYKQRFQMPYIGLTGHYRYENVEFSGTLKYSGWVKSSDNDEHYRINSTFRSKADHQNSYSLAASVGYYLTPGTKIYLEGVWNRTTNKKGNLVVNNNSEDTSISAKNSSGIENDSIMTTAGLKYSF